MAALEETVEIEGELSPEPGPVVEPSPDTKEESSSPPNPTSLKGLERTKSRHQLKRERQLERKVKSQLSTFVPHTMKYILKKEKKIDPPKFWSFESVGLWADVRGFTVMTEALARRGPIGTELLASNLNAYLAMIVKEILNAGGDIIKFAGDAMLCVWPPPNELLDSDDFAAQSALLPDTLTRVIQCAQQIQEKYGELQLKKGTPQLTVKLGVGVGTCAILVIGGTMGRCEYLACGEAFLQAFSCEGDCDNAKQIVVSGECQKMIPGRFEMTKWKTNGNYLVTKRNFRRIKKKALEMEDISQEFAAKLAQYVPSAVGPHLIMPSLFWAGELRQVTIMFLSLPFKGSQLKKLRTKIVKNIHDTIVTLQQTIYLFQGSLNKFLIDDKGSTVMAVFGLPPVAHDNDAERAVMASVMLKKRLGELQITQSQQNTVVDSITPAALLKGIGARKRRGKGKGKKKKQKATPSAESPEVAVGGASPSSGLDSIDDEKKEAVAVKSSPVAAEKMRETAIGLASGFVFLGLVGGTGSRREYSLLGDKVNLAARLMYEAKTKQDKWGSIAVDESVASQCIASPHIDWQFMGETQVKGKAELAQIWKPTKKELDESAIDPVFETLLETGDHKEISKAQSKVNEMCKTGKGTVLLAESEVGMGKTSLLMRCARQADSRCWFLWGRGDWIHETLPKATWVVWKQVLVAFQRRFSFCSSATSGSGASVILRSTSPMGGASAFGGFDDNRESFGAYMRMRRPDLVEWLFLLNDLMPVADTTSAAMDLRSHPEWDYLSTLNMEKRKDPEKADIVRMALYDTVMCLLEWAAHKWRPIVVVLDKFHWIRRDDWHMTRRLIAHIKMGTIRKVSLYLGSAIMDNSRYKPHYIQFQGPYVQEYTELRRNWVTLRLKPHPWGVQKVKAFIRALVKEKRGANVVDVTVEVVEIVHSLCGGRPGFCKPFVISLEKSSSETSSAFQLSEMRTKSNKRLKFAPHISDRIAKKTLRFEIPPSVVAITARQMDVMRPELSICLTVAAVLCVPLGLRHLHFKRSELAACHPVEDMRTPEKLNAALKELKNLKFIGDRPESDRQLEAKSRSQFRGSRMVGYVGSAGLRSSSRRRASSKTSSFGSTVGLGFGIGSPPLGERSSFDEEVLSDVEDLDDADSGRGFGLGLGGLLSSGTEDDDSRRTSERTSTKSKKAKRLDKLKGMPKTRNLLRKPFDDTLWFKGMLWKKKRMFYKELERLFVFKGRTLYWMRDDMDKHPVGRIHFGQVLKLRRKDPFRIVISLSGGTQYTLRSTDEKEIYKWMAVFTIALDTSKSKARDSVGEMALSKAIDDGDDDVDHEFVFSYGFLRDNVYNQTLFEQRTKIHSIAAVYYREKGNVKQAEGHLVYVREAREEDTERIEKVIYTVPIQRGRKKEVDLKREEILSDEEKKLLAKKKKKKTISFGLGR